MVSFYLHYQCPNCLANTSLTIETIGSLPAAVACAGCGRPAKITHVGDMPEADATFVDGQTMVVSWLSLQRNTKEPYHAH